MKLYLNGFWNDDPLDFFVLLIQEVFQTPVELGSFEESEVLFESTFSESTRLFSFFFFFHSLSIPFHLLDLYQCMHAVRDASIVDSCRSFSAIVVSCAGGQRVYAACPLFTVHNREWLVH